ncbi:MAG: SDR family oxidoreductase [Pseudomonadota bacterium]
MSGNFVIAGGSKGIGLELVNQLREPAESVTVYSRTQGDLEVSGNVVHHSVDFTQSAVELPNLPDAINGIAYCPGSINLRSFRSLKEDDFRNDLEVNLFGAIRFLQACTNGLKKGGADRPSSVVLFSTVAVATGMQMHASVAASKGALEGVTRTLAREWAPKIRVNCIAPALTETPLAARFFSSEESRQAMAAKYPLGRTGQPGDLAATAKFLLSQDAGWITGQTIGVDGGMSTLG